MLSVSGLLYMRWTQPRLVRPIKVNVLVPIAFVVICLFLIVMPCVEAPFEVGMGAALTLSGVPAYYFGVYWKDKPVTFQNIMGTKIQPCYFICTDCKFLFTAAITTFSQKLFLAAHEEE